MKGFVANIEAMPSLSRCGCGSPTTGCSSTSAEGPTIRTASGSTPWKTRVATGGPSRRRSRMSLQRSGAALSKCDPNV